MIKKNLFRSILIAVLVLFPLLTRNTHTLAQGDIKNKFIYLPVILGPGPSWLATVNQYRAAANLPPVSEDAAYSNGDYLHARYAVKNNVLQHSEDPANPWYTAEGNSAADASNVAATSASSVDMGWAIQMWMEGPFHAVGILDPHLLKVGYGAYSEADGGLQSAAALNVMSGRSDIVSSSVKFPISWPGNGSSVNLYQYTGGESPDPLSSCPGYSTPTGLPIILMIGSGGASPSVNAHSLTHGGTALEHCVYHGGNYTNSNASYQNTGQAVLKARDAIVLIPRSPLSNGDYTASITVNGTNYTWSFKVSH